MSRPAGSAAPFGSRLLGSTGTSRRRLRIRVQVLLTLLLIVTNVIGAVIVVGILLLIRPDTPVERDYLLASFIAVPTYVVAAVVIGAAIGTGRSLAALRWAIRGDTPSQSDRRRALRVPLWLTAMQVFWWALATCLFTLLAAVLDPPLWTTTLMAVGIAGIVVCAISYLLAEFVMRPVAARALEHGLPMAPRGSGVRRRLLVFWALGTGVPITGLLVASILALVGDDLPRTRLAVVGLVIGMVVLVFGLLVTLLNSRAVVGPLASVTAAMERVEAGDFESRVPVYDGSELGVLQSGFNRMSAGLAERERIRDLFGRHVGADVAEAALTRDAGLGGEVRSVSVLFVDLKGSTTLATRLSATEVVDLLNRFCAIVVAEVERHQGLVNKFMGDAVLAVFGAPVTRPDHATSALRAARTMVERLGAEVPEIDIGAGVATGEAVAGNVGDRSRFEYTVIGDAVNSAARLTELAKTRPGRLVAALASVEDADPAEAACWVADGSEVLRGRDTPTALAVPRDPASAG